MRETFVDKKFSAGSLSIIDMADAICNDYARQGYALTLRQLYYQFVARDLLANKQENYNRLGRIVSDARLAGLLDWSHLTDRGREAHGLWFGVEPSIQDHIERAARSYYLDLWAGQEYRVEAWVEKQALIDVVDRSAGRYRAATFACKGYVSQSEMYAAALRMREYDAAGERPVILHLGDHDPSGIDMTRDIRERLELLSGVYVDVVRIALNMDQVDEYAPPPNPAKTTDSRFEGYLLEHGESSWELDALNPSTLDSIITDHIERYLDADMFTDRVRLEESRRDRVLELLGDLDAS